MAYKVKLILISHHTEIGGLIRDIPLTATEIEMRPPLYDH